MSTTAEEAQQRTATQVTQVREVFVIRVGGTRCVTSSTDQIMNIHARIPLTVECIRTCILIFLLYVSIQFQVRSLLTFFRFDFQVASLTTALAEQRTTHAATLAQLDGKEHAMVCAIGLVHVGGTRCVTSSTGNIMKIRARITLTVEFIRTCIFLLLLYV